MNIKIFLVALLLLLSSCNSLDTSTVDTESVSDDTQKESVKIDNTTSIDDTQADTKQVDFSPMDIEDINTSVWVDGLDIPWELVFIDDTTALVTQRGGTVNKIINGKLDTNPYWEAPSIERWEGGLMWLALHPNYQENGFIYAMYTYRKDFSLTTANKVVRLIEVDGKLEIESTIVDDIPAKLYHNGGRIRFGPDDKLYVTTWDASEPDISQDLSSLWGKILRVNDDGSIPDDNPFPDSLIYSYGHRNPQWIAWNSYWDLFMSTHGPSWEFGLRAKDRVDYITPGTNYGWPLAYGLDQWYPNPIAYWPEIATPPGWMEFWNGSLYLATLKSAALVQLNIQKISDWYELTSENRWFEGEYGRLRDATVWPDWNLYVLTSNGDGRSGGIWWEDMILKIEKK